MRNPIKKDEKLDCLSSIDYYEFNGTIDEVTACLNKYNNKYKKSNPEYYRLEFRLGVDYEGHPLVELYGRRKETIEEKKEREKLFTDIAQKRKQEEEDKDIKELNRLKEKYPEKFKGEK